MAIMILFALVILILEFRTISKQFQTPAEAQNEEKEKILNYIGQMRMYLGIKMFKYITILSSVMINSLYIVYYICSAYFIHFTIFQILGAFLAIYRIFKIIDIFDFDYETVDYIVGFDIVIGMKTIISILHVTITFVLLSVAIL